MKKLTLSVAILTAIITCIYCNNQGNKENTVQLVNSSDVSVYYFHFTNRCATCLAVEENARKAVEELYPNEVKTGDYSFSTLNLDETNVKDIADKLGVGGQALIVVHGDKKIDITSAAWFNAHDLEKMKVEVKSGIDKVLF